MTQASQRRIAWAAVGLAVCVALALRDLAAVVVESRVASLYRHTIGQETILPYYLGWVLLTPLIFFLARRVPLRRDGWLRPLGFHLVTSVIITAVARVAWTYFCAVRLAGVPWAELPNPLSWYWTQYAAWRAVTDTFVYWLILAAAFALHIYDENRAREQHAAELQRTLVAAQVQALKMKLQPHFLFNTLNSISFLAVEHDVDGVVAIVERLGSLLRSSMQSSGSHLVTVAEELALLDQYLSIEEIRFTDRLRVIRRVEPTALSALIPSLVLQPIIENSIKHGFSRRIDASRLEIAVVREGDALVVTIEDDGPGVPPGWDMATDCGRGLKNVIERLDKLYPAAWEFTLQNRAPGGAIARLRVPWQQQPAATEARLRAVEHLASAGHGSARG